LNSLSIITTAPEETRGVGEDLARYLLPSLVLALIGGLGSGKTTLIQGIARGLEVSSPVKSPSFMLIREYAGRVPLFHFDLYRITRDEEILNLGYEEYCYQKGGVVVIEWADRIQKYLPSEHLGINMSILGTSRRKIAFLPKGPLCREIVDKMRRRLKREM